MLICYNYATARTAFLFSFHKSSFAMSNLPRHRVLASGVAMAHIACAMWAWRKHASRPSAILGVTVSGRRTRVVYGGYRKRGKGSLELTKIVEEESHFSEARRQ